MNRARFLTPAAPIPALLTSGAAPGAPKPNDEKSDNPSTAGEARHYRLVTLPIPADVVLEVGGLAMRPDGKLLACTRRGEVWLISDPSAQDLSKVHYKLFASGLHEALGILVENKNTVYVVQRPELTKLVDTDG